MNQVVAHTKTGQLIKGITNNFLPNKESFHLLPAGSAPGTKPMEVFLNQLKALFFVKDLQGQRDHQEKNAFDPYAFQQGKKIRVVFQDGEVLVGLTQGYQPGRPGFFMVPADPKSNNERCYIVASSTKEVTLL
ncbi:MAG TPA: hypothetical protein PKM35_14270 [Holophaga sp.]|nr:hypothetical protein [Holophaga sp.]HPS69060.1 hypothetical protein [Holophaga sp.]